MKMIYLLLIVLFLTSVSIANSCWKIKNKDTQALCESKFENKQNCWKVKIKRHIARQRLMVRLMCWKIKERDLQALCEAEKGR